MGERMQVNTLTVQETAQRLGVSKKTIYNWIHSKRLRAFKLDPQVNNSPLRITDTSIQEIEQARAQQTQA